MNKAGPSFVVSVCLHTPVSPRQHSRPSADSRLVLIKHGNVRQRTDKNLIMFAIKGHCIAFRSVQAVVLMRLLTMQSSLNNLHRGCTRGLTKCALGCLFAV